MEIGTIVEQLGKLIMIFYFLDYIIAPHACEVLKIKNLLFEEKVKDMEPGEERPTLKYEIGESIHWGLEKITQGLVLLGCLCFKEGSPYVEIGIIYLIINWIFDHTENASLRDAFYRLISIVAISILILSEEIWVLGLSANFQ